MVHTSRARQRGATHWRGDDKHQGDSPSSCDEFHWGWMVLDVSLAQWGKVFCPWDLAMGWGGLYLRKHGHIFGYDAIRIRDTIFMKT